MGIDYEKFLSALNWNFFYNTFLQLEQNMKYFVVVSKKGRIYDNKYSVSCIKLNKLGKIIFEEHEMSFSKLKEAIEFQGYVAKNIIKP